MSSHARSPGSSTFPTSRPWTAATLARLSERSTSMPSGPRFGTCGASWAMGAGSGPGAGGSGCGASGAAAGCGSALAAASAAS
eukprot:8640589-Lingulodinium_polyedra.AAC.1